MRWQGDEDDDDVADGTSPCGVLYTRRPRPLSLPFLSRSATHTNLDIIALVLDLQRPGLGQSSSNLLLIHYLENNATRNTSNNISRHSIPLKTHS
jgi:hypothetical protein